MNKLFLSADAHNDLREIQTYITEELENPDAAMRVVAGITKRLRMLETHGELGARLTAITGQESEYRYLVCGNYTAFYRYETGTVFIDRILYGRRDFMRVLLGELTEQ